MAPEPPPRASNGRCRGLTLVELLLALVVMATLTTLATASYSSYMQKARISRAEGDLTAIEGKIQLYEATHEDQLPTSLSQVRVGQLLDPWGHTYQYLDFTGLHGKGRMRKDHNLVPINSDYDLYSVGPDDATTPPLVAAVSRDDVIRANNGGYIGLAADY